MSESMPHRDAAWIERRVRLHNALNAAGFLLAIPAAVFLWALSFWFARFAVLFFLHAIGIDDYDWLGSAAGAAFLAVLAIEGWRHRRPLFDLGYYARSDFNLADADKTTRALSRHYGNPLGIPYIISQVLLCAPRTTIMALVFHRARLP